MRTLTREPTPPHAFGLNIVDDDLGGVPDGGLCLVSGGANTGRTPLALHFINNGLQNGEQVALITNYKPIEILGRAMQLGMPMDDYLRNSQLILLEQLTQEVAVIGNEADLEQMIEALDRELLPWNPTRLIIDSAVPFIGLFDPEFRQLGLPKVLRHLHHNGMSVMMTTLMPITSEALAVRHMLEDMAGCSLHMDEQCRPNGEVQRRLAVRKLRGVEPPYPVYTFDLSSETGIHILGRMDFNQKTPLRPRQAEDSKTPPPPDPARSKGLSFRNVQRKTNS